MKDKNTQLILDAMDQRFAVMQTYMDTRFNKTQLILDTMNQRFNSIDQRLDGVDSRFDIVEAKLEGLDAGLAEVRGDVKGLQESVENLNVKADVIDNKVTEIGRRQNLQAVILDEHDQRLINLEAAA